MKDSKYTIHKCQCLDFLFKIQQCETATIENDDKKLDLTSDGDDEHNFKMVLKLEAESEYSSTRNKRKAISNSCSTFFNASLFKIETLMFIKVSKLNLSGKPSQRKILTLDVLWILFKMTLALKMTMA